MAEEEPAAEQIKAGRPSNVPKLQLADVTAPPPNGNRRSMDSSARAKRAPTANGSRTSLDLSTRGKRSKTLSSRGLKSLMNQETKAPRRSALKAGTSDGDLSTRIAETEPLTARGVVLDAHDESKAHSADHKVRELCSEGMYCIRTFLP